MTKDYAPFRIPYNEFFTIQHFLLECHDPGLVCNRIDQSKSRKNIFSSTPSCTIRNYLKELVCIIKSYTLHVFAKQVQIVVFGTMLPFLRRCALNLNNR